MSKVIPAVLEKTAESLVRTVAFLPEEARFVHVDVLEEDVWVPIEREFEAHLMVKDPGAILHRWIERGAKRVIVHTLDGMHVPQNLPSTGFEIGFGVEMQVPLESVYAEMGKADFIHLMSIDAIGSQGQPFDERIFDRIREVRERFPDKRISVDGGIDASNAEQLLAAGADTLVVGSHFKEVWTLLTKKL